MTTTTMTATIPYAVAMPTPSDGPGSVTMVTEPDVVAVDVMVDVDVVVVVVAPALLVEDVAAPSWFVGQVSPQELPTSLQPRASFGSPGFAGVASQFPVSIPPVSVVWPLSM